MHIVKHSMLMSYTEKHRKWEMHSVEHCIRVLFTEKPRKSDGTL